MKAYTDIEQSKKLAKILPLESSDMSYDWFVIGKEYSSIPQCRKFIDDELPCWSLAALLGILANETHNIDDDGYIVLSSYKGNWWNISPINCITEEIKESNNLLDAAFEMVVRLKENNKI